jgi:hypothetical protein
MKQISLLTAALILALNLSRVFAQEAPGDEALAEKLKKTAEISANNMEMVGEPQFGVLDKRGTTSIEIQLDKARCYTFVVVGDTGVTDLSLTINAYDKEVASDRISGKQPLVKWCAPGRVKVEAKLTMYSGSGSYALGVYGEHQEAPTGAERVGGNGSDFISNRIRQLHGQFGKGRAAITPVFRGNLSTGNDQIFKVRLKAEHCYTIVSAGSPSVRNLDITLIDENGTELAKDKKTNNFPTVDTEPCLRAAGQYKIKVNMFSGFGQFGLQVFSD